MLSDETNSFYVPDPTASVDLRLHFSQAARPGYLSVVIPVYDDVDGLQATLESLLAGPTPREKFEVIVANDGGDPAISDLCVRHGVREIVIRPNGGSYNARSRGIEGSSGEYIALIDADEVVSPGWMEAIFQALAAVDFVAGPVALKTAPRPSPLELYQILYPPCDPRPREDMPDAFYFTTANMAARRRVFEELGGFDSRMRSGGDWEFSDRVTRAGHYRQSYSAEMKVIHPCRTCRQIIQRNRRTFYGELSLLRLHPSRFRQSAFPARTRWKLFFPDMRAFRPDVLDLKLDWNTYLRLFFLMWWMKLRRLEMLLSMTRQAANVR